MSLNENPLYAIGELPDFPAIEVQHVVPALSQRLDDARVAVTRADETLAADYGSAITAYEDACRELFESWGVVGHLLSVRNTEELRAAHAEMQPKIIEFSMSLGQNRARFDAMTALFEGSDYASLSPARQRVLESEVRSAKHDGVGLDGEQKERFNAIAQRLSKLGTTFSNNLIDSTKAFELVLTSPEDVVGLPDAALRMFAGSYAIANETEANPGEGPWRVSLDGPSFTAFLKHASRTDLREQVYRAFVTRASRTPNDNGPLLEEILALRQERAQLLGYDNYAELSLSGKMAEHEQVLELLERLHGASSPHAAAEHKDIQGLASAAGCEDELQHWDLAYWGERLREKRSGLTDDDLRPYFPLPAVLQGLFGVIERLFGMTAVEVETERRVWHPDVRYFEMRDESGQTRAGFYLDPYARPADKRGGAWMNAFVGRRRAVDGIVNPVAYLVCNGTPPTDTQPSLMTFSEVETLFHEFGHGLQHMLTDVEEAGAAGINNVEWDAVELPSQFMENWCYHRETLMGMARHFETGEPLPEDYFRTIVEMRHFGEAYVTLRQVVFGLTDLELHSSFDPRTEGALDVYRRVATERLLNAPVEGDRFLCAFGHIFAGGYSAGYYSYKWAEVLSADAFEAFLEVGLDNTDAVAAVGRRFRDTVLGLGGSKHPSEVYRAFRGRDASPDALLRQNGLEA